MDTVSVRSVISALAVGVLCFASAYAGYVYRGLEMEPKAPPGIVLARGALDMPRHTVDSKIAGQLAELMVASGDLVVEGQAIGRLEGGPLETDLQAARARLAILKQQFAVAQTERTKFKSALSLAETQAALSEAKLLAGSISQASAKADQARLENAIAQYDQANKVVAAIRDDATAEQATIDQLKARQESLLIRAPVNGRVGRVLAEPNQQLGAESPVAEVIDTSRAFLALDIDGEHLDHIKNGAEARVVVAPLPHRILHARVATEANESAPVAGPSVELGLGERLAAVLKPGDVAVAYIKTASKSAWPLALE